MIQFLPAHNQTLVLPFSFEEISHRIANLTSNNILFTGLIKGNKFRIGLKASRPNHFAPFVKGKIEPTSTGCIVFLSYRLLPFSQMILSAGLLTVLFSALSLGYQHHNILYALMGVGIDAIICWIAWMNFSLHLKTIKANLQKILS